MICLTSETGGLPCAAIGRRHRMVRVMSRVACPALPRRGGASELLLRDAKVWLSRLSTPMFGPTYQACQYSIVARWRADHRETQASYRHSSTLAQAHRPCVGELTAVTAIQQRYCSLIPIAWMVRLDKPALHIVQGRRATRQHGAGQTQTSASAM